MKLIISTSPFFFIEEDKILTTLFEEGLEILHLHKFQGEPVYFERLLSLIPSQYHNRIVVCENYYLQEEYGLMGIHLNDTDTTIPGMEYKGRISRSCHNLDELDELKKNAQYVTLKHVFDSISDTQSAHYSIEELQIAARKGQIDRKVIAQTGININNIPITKELGFGGVLVSGDIWKRFDPHSENSFKELITHFRQLQKAVNK